MNAAEPYDNTPARHPNGDMRLLSCEVTVYSSARWDMGGHQCGKVARWRVAEFDKWGDIILCGLHKDGRASRATELFGGFGRNRGEPTSIRWKAAV